MVNLDALRPGESVVYFEGTSLARRRAKDPADDPQIEAANAAWAATLAGTHDLLQRRVGNKFQYLIVKRRTVDSSPVLPIMGVEEERRRAA